MDAKKLPERSVLLQLLRYEPETGKLFWKERGTDWFPARTPARSLSLCRLWNERYAGSEAFTALSDGYRYGSILGTNYKAHRVIWSIVHGASPIEIDHINGDRADNRLANLRNVNAAINARNKKVDLSKNVSGVVGVYRWTQDGNSYWVAHLGNKKQVYCKTFEAAVAARKDAERKYGFHPNHGQRRG